MFNSNLSAPLVSIPANELVKEIPVNHEPVNTMYAVAIVSSDNGNQAFSLEIPKDISIAEADDQFKYWARQLKSNLPNVLEIVITVPGVKGNWSY